MSVLSVYVRQKHIPTIKRLKEYAQKNEISFSQALWKAVEFFLNHNNQ